MEKVSFKNEDKLQKRISNFIQPNEVTMFTIKNCKYCDIAAYWLNKFEVKTFKKYECNLDNFSEH